MFGFVFLEKCSLSGCIGPHDHVAEIYGISTNAVFRVFASMVLNSLAEIATFGVTYIYDGLVFVAELIYTRLSGDASYSFRVAESVPSIYWHNTLTLYDG